MVLVIFIIDFSGKQKKEKKHQLLLFLNMDSGLTSVDGVPDVGQMDVEDERRMGGDALFIL